MVVDDSKVNIYVLKAMLSRLGAFDIVTAMDGAEAFKRLSDPGAAPVDLVLTDMWMPNMNGEGLVRAIRGEPRLAGIPVYAVTADVEIQKTFKAMGFSDILLKPVTLEMLKRVIESFSA